MNLKERAEKLKVDIPAVFIALKRKETPVLAKMIAAVTVAYALSPIDLIPDFIPFIGYLDDLILLPALIAITIKLIPKDVFEECRLQSKEFWQEGKPRMWYFALPIIVLWLIIIAWIIKVFIIKI